MYLDDRIMVYHGVSSHAYISMIDILSISSEIDLRWMQQDLTDD